jgi:hypothetical protein
MVTDMMVAGLGGIDKGSRLQVITTGRFIMFRSAFWIVIAGAAMNFAAWPLPQHALAVFPSHTFDSNSQGWTSIGSSTDYGPPSPTVGTGSIEWDARGNPGGALKVGDYFYSTWISAPASFLGNQSDMFGQTFSYDIFIRYNDQTSVPYPSVAMVGANNLKLLFTKRTPPLNTWDRRVIAFDPLLWTIDVGQGSPNAGNAPTQAQMYSVLNNVAGLYLLTEWRTGPDDTSVDNIGVGYTKPLEGDYNHDGAVGAGDYVMFRNSLGTIYTANDYTIWRQNFGATAASATLASAVPEPSTLWLIGLGAALLLQALRSRYG